MMWYGEGLTDTGCVRLSNQDAYLVNNERGLWIVADGMGSHQHSAIASQMVVDAINIFLGRFAASGTLAQPHHWETILHKAVNHAHDQIRAKVKAQPELAGMGTTVVLAFMPGPGSDHLYIAHAGDSRAYLFRDTTLTLLTRDHTLLEERIRDGWLPKDTPASHQLGHVLTKAIGLETGVDADCSHLALQPADTILLCSDGLIKMLNDEGIRGVLLDSLQDSSQDPCRRLILEANRLGGHDNVTVVIVQKKNNAARDGHSV